MFPEREQDFGGEPDLACTTCGHRSYAVAPLAYSEEVDGHARQRTRQPSSGGVAL